jgi:hypothetical protein
VVNDCFDSGSRSSDSPDPSGWSIVADAPDWNQYLHSSPCKPRINGGPPTLPKPESVPVAPRKRRNRGPPRGECAFCIPTRGLSGQSLARQLRQPVPFTGDMIQYSFLHYCYLIFIFARRISYLFHLFHARVVFQLPTTHPSRLSCPPIKFPLVPKGGPHLIDSSPADLAQALPLHGSASGSASSFRDFTLLSTISRAQRGATGVPPSGA